MSFSNLEIHWDENGERYYTKIETYRLFLQNCLIIFKEATRSLDDDDQTAPEFVQSHEGIVTKPHTAKGMTDSFGNETAWELKKNVTSEGSHIKQDFFQFLY